MRNPLTVEFILTKQVLAWCHGAGPLVGAGGGGVVGKGTGNNLLVVDQAPSDFSKAKLPPTVTAVPGERKGWGRPEGTCSDTSWGAEQWKIYNLQGRDSPSVNTECQKANYSHHTSTPKRGQ